MSNQAQILGTTIHVGDTIRVHQKVKEKDKERIQIFVGVVTAIKGGDVNKSFTVRRIAAAGIGVERIWPASSPILAKIEVKQTGKPRRAKLYYLKNRIGKQATKVDTGEPEKNAEKEPGILRRKSSPKLLKK